MHKAIETNRTMSNEKQRDNWLNSMTWQINFYRRSARTRRKDPEFQWRPYERMRRSFPGLRYLTRTLMSKLGLRPQQPMSLDWMREHVSLLWNTRAMFADDLSRLLFDSALVVRLTDHRRFYFPRIDFDDLLDFVEKKPFVVEGFPHDYLGVPLRTFDVRLRDRVDPLTLNIITRDIQLHLVNSYRQYLVRRNGVNLSPVPGDVVYDCGACIGEISLLFAALVAPKGEVHLFDPIPLHTRFCELQVSMNPVVASMLHVNTCAVGDSTHDARGAKRDSSKIAPGAVSTDNFACTTIDDYAAKQRGGIDFIKMDIEGAEMKALAGASSVIREFKPRLAISGYHKPKDLWEIPNKLKRLNPGYRIMFGHHTPIEWESVFYAVDESEIK